MRSILINSTFCVSSFRIEGRPAPLRAEDTPTALAKSVVSVTIGFWEARAVTLGEVLVD